MAYRYTGGMSIEDLTDINPERLMDMSESELDEVVSRLGKEANRRMDRGMKEEYPSPAVAAANRGGEFSTKGKDITGLRNEYARARSFLNNPLSTASGYKDLQRDLRNQLKDAGYNVKLKDFPHLIDSYRKLTEEDGSVLTRGERYKYMREIGNAMGVSDKEEAEKTGEQLLDMLADMLGDLGMGEEDESDDGSVAGFFRELE